jgi:hypothetical protein
MKCFGIEWFVSNWKNIINDTLVAQSTKSGPKIIHIFLFFFFQIITYQLTKPNNFVSHNLVSPIYIWLKKINNDNNNKINPRKQNRKIMFKEIYFLY